MDTADSPYSIFGSAITKMVQLPDSTWSLVDTLSGDDNPTPTAELYLSESRDTSVEQILRELGLELPPKFYDMHTKDMVVAWEPPLPGTETTFFAKWATPATQFRQQWDIEQRIAANKPYDTNAIRDPLELRLNHVRYERDPPFPIRPCHPVSSLDFKEGLISIALIECVSMYLQRIDGVTIGFVLFDPPPFHRKTHKKYAFWSDIDGPDTVTHESVFLTKPTCRDRFVEKLRRATKGNLEAGTDTAGVITNTLLEIMIEDELAVLTEINDSLNSIELSMASDEILSKRVNIWRDRFGRWKNLLFRSRNSVGHMLCVHHAWGTSASGGARTMSDRLHRLQDCIHSTSSRVDSTFQAFASTMSIVESGRAIRQAETVAKLTRLAFFFVPPTLITGIFGANINEFKDKLTFWHWGVSSLSGSLLTYLVFYRHQVLQLVTRAAHVLADTSPHRVSRIAIKWLTIARAAWRAAPDLLIIGLWLGLNAVVVMSLWQVIESAIALEMKQAVSLTFLSGYAGAAIFPLVLRYRQRRDKSLVIILLGGMSAVLLMFSGLGIGLWKILESPLASSAKTAASSGIMCSSALMSLASRFVASRLDVSCTATVRGEFGSI